LNQASEVRKRTKYVRPDPADQLLVAPSPVEFRLRLDGASGGWVATLSSLELTPKYVVTSTRSDASIYLGFESKSASFVKFSWISPLPLFAVVSRTPADARCKTTDALAQEKSADTNPSTVISRTKSLRAIACNSFFGLQSG
jgi:hypothetical protein